MAQLVSWLRSHGELVLVGVEGTGSYWVGVSRYLQREGVTVVEVDRPNRQTRHRKGKSDPVDALAAARAALSGAATGSPKARNGNVEAIRSPLQRSVQTPPTTRLTASVGVWPDRTGSHPRVVQRMTCRPRSQMT